MTQKRKQWSTDLKEKMSEAQNHRCCYCGVRMGLDAERRHYPTWEHVVPLVHGGRDELDNMVIACRGCNEDRAPNWQSRARPRHIPEVTHHWVWCNRRAKLIRMTAHDH